MLARCCDDAAGPAVGRARRRGRAYDANAAGEAAPETVFVTARQVREEFSPALTTSASSATTSTPRRVGVPRAAVWLSRERALPTVARVLGLDLYIHARYAALQERPAPLLEVEQRPDQQPAVLAALEVVVDQRAHGVAVEVLVDRARRRSSSVRRT